MQARVAGQGRTASGPLPQGVWLAAKATGTSWGLAEARAAGDPSVRPKQAVCLRSSLLTSMFLETQRQHRAFPNHSHEGDKSQTQ